MMSQKTLDTFLGIEDSGLWDCKNCGCSFSKKTWKEPKNKLCPLCKYLISL
ncbi:MAG: hypothetical protein ACFFG0_12205 [Candidatus Thorarchaeota archaeon]